MPRDPGVRAKTRLLPGLENGDDYMDKLLLAGVAGRAALGDSPKTASDPGWIGAVDYPIGRDDAPPLGSFEYEVLLSVRTLRSDAYPAEITRRLSKQLGRPVSLAQVFVALERLEAKQLVTHERFRPKPVRGGRTRRVFTIEASGVRALERTAAARQMPDIGPQHGTPQAEPA